MSYKEARIIKTLLGSEYIKISSKDIQKIYEFCKFVSTNCTFEEHSGYEFSSSLEFNFVRKITDTELIIFIPIEEERRFFEFLSTF